MTDEIILIGYLQPIYPRVIGETRLIGDFHLGQEIQLHGTSFRLNINYVPSNPKREKLVRLLVPTQEVPNSFWNHPETNKLKEEKPEIQEEFPF